jgi:hypothetical protein
VLPVIQVSLQAALSEHSTSQFCSHLMLQEDWPVHSAVLPAPSVNLQLAESLQTATDWAPVFDSHFAAPSQWI